LFLALAVLAWWLDSAWLAGYLAGGAMHLVLDIVFNGRFTPRNIFAFYSFGFRLAHGFDAETLFGSEPRIVPVGFWRSFFSGAARVAGRIGDEIGHAALPFTDWRLEGDGVPADLLELLRLLDAHPEGGRELVGRRRAPEDLAQPPLLARVAPEQQLDVHRQTDR